MDQLAPTGPSLLYAQAPNGDGSLAYFKAGAGLPVVFLHGWTLDHRQWRPQLPLASTYQLLLVDRRGAGRSTAPPDLSGEAADIAAIAGAGKFALVGLSQGASVALDVARRMPSQVAALVLAGAPLHNVVPYPEGEGEDVPRSEFRALVKHGRLEAMKAAWRRHPFAQVSSAARPLLDAMINDYDGSDLAGNMAQLSFTAQDIAQLAMPVLAMAGSNDGTWRREVARYIGRTAPQGTTRFIDAAGHLCNLDNPDEFNRQLTQFLGQHFSGDSAQ